MEMRMLKMAVVAGAFVAATALATAATAQQEIPRAPSTPDTPKNWVAPAYKSLAQALVDELMAKHPEVASITMHGTPPGKKDIYTMFAGSFDDRIGNESSGGDIITIKKGVTQVESKWGSANWMKRVTIVAPVKNAKGDYLPIAMCIAFYQSPTSGKIDTDFLQPGVKIRDSIMSRIASVEALFGPAK